MFTLKKRKSIPTHYSDTVLIGNWYESSVLKEHKLNSFLTQMKRGDLMLARYRKITENLNTPAKLTAVTQYVRYGGTFSLLSPYVPSLEGKKGCLLGGRISANDIDYTQELVDGCNVVCITNLQPCLRSAFVLASPDYCNRKDQYLLYNQEFLLCLASSMKKKPLYVRYDPDPCPGLNGRYPLYLSEHPVSNTRWRVLPVIKPGISRFEEEGTHIRANTDLIINHCGTNVNLGVSGNCWAMDFHGKVCLPIMKTCLNVYKCEEPNNIWQINSPLQK